MMTSNKINLRNALFAAVLLLPETFDDTSLYECIAGLSYLGTSFSFYSFRAVVCLLFSLNRPLIFSSSITM